MEGQKTAMLLEGLLPVDIWNAGVVILVLLGVFFALYKGFTMIRDDREKRTEKKKLKGKDLTDEIAEKVLEKLEPRFKDIENKLDNDKARLDNHDILIKAMGNSVDVVKEGMQVTCSALAAILDHELHNGNNEQMQEARDDLQAYTNGLIKRV